MLLKAMKEAEVVRDEIVSRARTEADHAVGRAREQIEREKTTAVLELRSHVVDIAMAAAAKIVESSMTRRLSVSSSTISSPRCGLSATDVASPPNPGPLKSPRAR